MSARDELAEDLQDVIEGGDDCDYNDMASALMLRGYRKIFDGDCSLSLIGDADKEASEAWMRWSNLILSQGSDPNGIKAMKQMLAEFGYRRPES